MFDTWLLSRHLALSIQSMTSVKFLEFFEVLQEKAFLSRIFVLDAIIVVAQDFTLLKLDLVRPKIVENSMETSD